MVRAFVFMSCLLAAFSSVAQQEDLFNYRHVLKASATLSPGFMLAQAQNNIYVNGHLEYFAEDKVSLRGDGFWFTGAQQKPQLLKENSTLLFGGLYHFHKNRLDLFAGLQTGMGFTRPADTQSIQATGSGGTLVTSQATESYKLKAIPVISPLTGITFYAGKYVNFFFEVRYLSGRYFGYNSGGTLRMDELRLSAGLGFQLPLRKG